MVCFPDALYIHPHMKMVKLTSPDSNLSDRQKQLNVRDDQSLVPLSEALHSFLPGMWTRRLPQTTFKVLAQETTPVGGRTLEANLERMEQGGLKFEVVNKSLPLHLIDGRHFRNFSIGNSNPAPLKSSNNHDNMVSIKILDYDEGKPSNQETNSEHT